MFTLKSFGNNENVEQHFVYKKGADSDISVYMK